MKIAITGAGGFLGSHLTEYFLSLGHTVKEITRSTVDLTSGQEVEKWFLENGPIDCVIHTAINGGRAEDTDNIKSFTENLQMYYTLSSQKDHFKVDSQRYSSSKLQYNQSSSFRSVWRK